MRLLLLIIAIFVLLFSLFISIYLYRCRFRFGNGVTVEFKPGRQSYEEALRNFLTAFSIFTSIQSGILFFSFTVPNNNYEIIIYGISSFLIYLIGLFYTLTLILSSSLGGVSIPIYHFTVLMVFLGIGTTLTILLLRAII
jgi:hypothetical protein